MTREEMLNKLHSIRVGAQPTVITNDMGLQYEYVTKDGHGEGFGDMGDWPAYKITGVSNEKLESLKQKVRCNILTVADLENTDLILFYNKVFGVCRPEEYIPALCGFFENLISVVSVSENTLFALCDAHQLEPKVFFYSTYDELEKAFTNRYACCIEEWERLEDDELEVWLKRTENELDTIPFIILHDED